MKFFKLFTVAVLCSLYFVLCTNVRAQDEFSVDTAVTYNVQETGTTLVTHNIILENNFSDLYATTYTLSLENINASNIKALNDSGGVLPLESLKDGNRTDIKISFPDTSVGKGVQRKFSISYENTTFAVRTGEVWEVSIPKLGSESIFRNYQLFLVVPKSFGLEAYISPKPASSELSDKGYSYTFDKNVITQTGISAGYGQFQVFTFNLSYHLENPLSKSSTTEIALPPDTAFQKVYIQKIEPAPANVKVDSDGNWIATYSLSARERIDVVVTGSVQIFASFRSFTKPDENVLSENLKETGYWQVNDPRIQALAQQLKTPEAIYNYVSRTLTYDASRVQSNVQRMGALKALENPSQAICMEFTDLFIAIARAAGIPAREVNGFAYTENPDLQPLGLVADVLHSWPEYYDRKNGVWIAIDPTWGSTSGIDFFNKLDLRHFTFVNHGVSSTLPYPPGSYKLGPNPQKDVFVSFGQLPTNRISIPNISIEPYRILPFFSSIYLVTISNPGPVALYSTYPTIYFDLIEKSRDYIEVLAPYSSKQIQVSIPYSLLGKDTPNVIKVGVNASTSQIITNKKQVVVYSLVAVLVALIIITVFILFKLKKIKIMNIFAKIVSSQKKHDETIKTPPENKDND